MLFRHPSSRKNMRAARRPRTPRTILRWRPTFDILEDRVVPTLSFMTQPVSTATGQLMAQIQVKSDAAASVPVTLSLSALTTSGTPILGGKVTQNTDAASHIATFTNLFVYGGSGKSVTLTASSGLDIIVSTTFEVKPGGDHLYVSSTIPTTMAGASLGSIDVVELDAGGSVESSDSQTVVQLFLQDNPGGAQFRNATSGAVISTPITSKLVNGKATFTGVALDKVGIGYTLGVVAANASPNNTTLLPGTSNAFVVTAGAPANLSYLVQPTYTDRNPSNDQGQVFTINKYLSNRSVADTWTGVVVGVVDKFGNPVINGVTGQVTISTDGKFSDKVTADDLTKDIDPNTGVAVFDNLQWRRNVEHLVRITQDSDTVQVLDNVADLAVGMTIGNPELDPFKAYFLPGTTILQIDMSNPSNLLLKLSKKAQNSTDPKGIGAVPFNFQKDGGFTLTATPVGLKDTNGPITAQAVMSAPFDVGVDRRRALQFVQGFALPTTAQVRSKLPVVKVQVVNAFGQVITADNSDVIRIASGGITGTLYRTVVNGVATFDDLAVGGLALKLANGTDAPPLVVNFEFVNQALSPVGGTKPPELQLTAGPAHHLRIVNPDRLVGMDNMITAGGYVRDSKGNPIEIDVVDQDNNLITTDTTTVVSIGLLPNEGRGPVYVGNGPMAGKIDYSKTVQKNPNDSFDFQAVKTVVGGKAIFNNLYIDFAGQNYILSAGTTNFVNHAGADTAPFMVVADKASHLEFVNQVNTTNALARIVSFNPAQWLPGQYKAMNSVVVAALDPFGNVDPNFLDAVKLDLQPLTGTGTLKNSNILKGKDPLAVVAFGGFAVFNTFYITAMGSYTLKASDPDNDSVTATGPSNSFMVTASSLSSDAIGNPVITISSIGTQKSGTAFEVTVEIHKDFFPKEHYLGNAVVNLELRDKDGNPVPEKVATFKYNPEAIQDADGNFKYTVTIALGAGVTQGQFTILALLNLKAKTKLSNPPFTDPIDPVFGTPTGTSTDPVAYGLGSLDTNYDAISSFPVYNGNIPPGGRPFPPVVGFDPAQVTDNTLPALQQPNVADGFDQVAQSSKWWSSLIFPRTKVAATDVKTPQDSQQNQLFALTAGPLAAMVNDNGPHQEGNFAGLGLTYLTDSALFVQPSKAFNDPPPPNVPAGQPQAWLNPEAPGAERWQYRYDGNANPRLYQDLSVGLAGVQADGKVLRYSDWTVTLDWKGQNASKKAEELQATLGEGLPFTYFTVPTASDASPTAIQLVTSPKNNFDVATQMKVSVPVKVKAFKVDPSGTRTDIQNGVGPFELEMSYSLHDVLDNIPQLGSADGSMMLTVQDTTVLLPGMSVVGQGVPDDTDIAPNGIVDATHIMVTKVVPAVPAGTLINLTFNSLRGPHFTRTFDNFYGVFLPDGVAWSLKQGADSIATLSANLASKNYFSVAALPTGTGAEFNKFLPHAYTFVTGSTSSFSFDESTGKVSTTYALQTVVKQTVSGTTDTGPLQALNATQYNNLPANEMQALKNSPVAGLKYVSPHGALLLWDGAVFHTQLQYTGVLPSVAPLDANQGQADLWQTYLLPVLRSASSQPQTDGSLSLDLLFPNDNNYLQSQSMYGASQLVPILLEVSTSTDPGLSANDKALAARYAEQLYNAVKDRMSSWLSASDDQALQVLYYQPATPQETNAKQHPPAGAQGWRSLMSILSGFLSSETLNDHQLIAGYFIKTAAFLAQYDPSWGGTTQAADAKGTDTSFLQGKMGDIVNLMVGDVANYDRSSKIFPFMRNLDVYAMHTWADGAANDNVGTNLESSSEAMNFDSGLILWGQATGNRALRDLGIYLYTTELEGAQTYWFSIKNQTDPFGNPTDVIPRAYLGTPGPSLTATTTVGSTTLTLSSANLQVARGQSVLGPGIAPNTTVDTVNGTTVTLSLKAVAGAGTFTYTFGGTQRSIVTKLNSNGGAYVGFIGFQTSRVTGIQLLPFGGAAYYLGQDASFVAKTYQLAQAGATAPGVIPVLVPTYQSLLLPYLALSDADTALTLYKQNINAIQPTNPLDLVDNNAFNIHWIEALQAYGHVDATVHADTVSYAVFNKNGTRTYVAYNPDAFERTVNFRDKDGNLLLTVKVAPRTTLVSRGSGTNPTTVAQQTTPNYALKAPQNRLFVTSSGGNPTLSYGKAGAGEKAVVFSKGKDLEIKVTGLYGSLQNQNALPAFELWFDPQFRKGGTGAVAPVVQAFLTINDGQGHTAKYNYGQFPMPLIPGFVKYVTNAGGGLNGLIPFLPTSLVNGSVTLTLSLIKNDAPNTEVRLRTDAAAQQGRVSFLDLPYTFTKVAGTSVTQLSLGGQTLGKALPNIAGTPPPPTDKRPGDPPNGFNATLTGSTATFTAVNLDNQTLMITADPASGLLMNNRFATGDEGYASPFDFDTAQPGVQVLAATAASTVQIQGGRGDAIILGSEFSAASSLLAHFQVATDAAGSGSFFIDDSARNTTGAYTLDKAGSGLGIATDDGGLDVTLQGSSFKNGIALTTGASVNNVGVLATRAGEALTLDTEDSHEHVDIGGVSIQNLSNGVENILGDVIVRNTSPGGFTDVIVDGGDKAAAPAAVTVSDTAIVGLAPAVIRYDNSSIDELTILGGGLDTTYLLTGSLGGSGLALGSGGSGSVILSHDGRVNPGFFPGSVSLVGGDRRLIIDDSAETSARNVTVNNGGVTGLISPVAAFSILGFSDSEIRLGTGANTLSIDTADFDPQSATVTSDGDLGLLLARIHGDLNVTGKGTVTVGTGSGGTAISTQGGKVTILAPAGITVDQTIDTSPGSGGVVTLGANVTPSQSTDPKYHAGAGNIQLNDAATARTIAVVSGSGQSNSVGTAFATALVAKVTDASDNPVSGATVIFTAPANGPSGTFQTGTTIAVAVTDSNGLATASTFTANTVVGGPYVVTATTTASTTPANFSLTNTVGVVSRVGFVQGPTTGVFNTVINPAVTVQLEDEFGNPVTTAGVPVSLAIGDNPGSATLSGSGPVLTDGTGLATFSNLKLSAGGIGYTLVASSGSLTQATSLAFDQATQLVFIQGPISATANTVIAPPITVQAEDQFGNPVFGLFPVTMALGANPGGATLSGTLTQTTDIFGEATFDDLMIDNQGIGYTLVASTGTLSVTSAAFNETGAADGVVFLGQPSDAIIGGTISPAVTVQVVDASGLAVGGTYIVTIAIGANPGGGTLSGTLTQTTSPSGLATFDDLSIDLPGVGNTLVATVTALPNPSVTSDPFNEKAQFVFFTEPTNSVVNTPISPAVVVQAQDAFGNPVSGVSIALSIGNNPGGSTLSGSGAQVTGSSGFASFSNLSLDNPGTGYTLVATAGVPGDSVTSAAFAEAGPATQLAFIHGPTSGTVGAVLAPPITVQVEDALGNPVPGFFGISISLGTNPGGGVLLGTLGQTTDNLGLATFNDLLITAPGDGYTLVAASGTLTVATSTAFDQTTTQLSFLQQPSNGNINTAISPAIQVEAVDEFNNPLSGVMITMTLGTNPGGGTLTGGVVQTTDALGIATFPDLQIDQPGIGYTLVATSASPGSTSVTSAEFDQAGVATQLAFVQQPASGAGGVAISPAVTVQVEDANGAPVSGSFSIVVTIGNNPGGGTLGGTTIQMTDASGLATFDDLTISAVGTDYTLVASSGVLTGATSAAFDQVGVPSQLIFVQQPTSGGAGTVLSPPVTVDVLDQFGNPLIGSFSVTVALGNNPGSGNLDGTLTQTTNSSSQATFDDLTIDQPGTGYTLVASLSGVPDVTSAAFDEVTVASQLAFVQPPISGTVGAVLSPPVTVQVEDSSGTPKTGTFTITIALGANPGGGVLGGTLTQTTNSSGLATFSDLTLSKPGMGYTLVASSGSLTDAESTAFNEVATATHFQVTAPSPANASAAFLFTVTALDAFNDVVPTYTGTVHFTSSDAGAGLPGDYLFTTGPGGDNGVHTFTGTLTHGGAQTITATDTTSSTLTGTSTVTVVEPTVPPVPPVPPAKPTYLFITDQVGRGTRVRVFNAQTVSELFSSVPLPGFHGVLRLAQGDVNHDGVLDVIVGTGPGGKGRVRVINGRTHGLLAGFRPFPAAFRRDVVVAAADVNGDGFADVFVLAQRRHGLVARIFDGKALANGQVVLIGTQILKP